MRYRGFMAYDGSHFHGFQDQPGKRTVQGTVEEALSRIAGVPITLYGAGRTDAGVHACAMPIAFTLPDDIPPAGLLDMLSRHLPHDISLFEIGPSPEGFHPRFSALEKTYRYLMSFSLPVPFLANYIAYDSYRTSSIENYMKALAYFKGTHDFTSFTKNKEAEDYIRTITRLEVSRKERIVTLELSSSGFLHNEVRIIAGCAQAVARGRISLNSLADIERVRSRTFAPFLAPAAGLYLVEVTYPDGYAPGCALDARLDIDPSTFLFRLAS